jgi:hypothetical protein
MADADPRIAARQLVMGFRGTHLLFVAAELGVADLLADGPRGSTDLAAELGADSDALRRVLRALAQLGVLDQEADGRFSLTSIGACLRSDQPDSLRPVARFWGHETVQRAWGNLRHTVMTGETAFDHVFGMPTFAYLEAHPEAAAVYHSGMAQRTAAAARAAVAEAYDFAPVDTIVDVGGGNGSLLAAILQAFPGPRGVVCDQASARSSAEETIRGAGLTGRARFETCDFFAAVPSGGDCYLLRQVVHDWDDDRAAAILRTCRRAVPPQGRLLLIELVVPVDGEPGLEALMLDITMLAQYGGRERTQAEYRTLLERAGFRLARIVPTPVHGGRRYSILECLPA